MNTTVAMAVTASATTICQNGPDDRQHGAHRLHLLTADDDAHGGRLAGTVGADESRHPPRDHVDRHVVQDSGVAVRSAP